MALEIQGAVNSMIGSVGNIIQQNEENKRKALNIALGAITGGVGGAITSAAKQAGINSKAVGQLTGTQTDIMGDVPVQTQPVSIAEMANQQAHQSLAEAREIKRKQTEFDNMETSLGKMKDLPENLQARIKEAMEKNG